MAYNLYRPGDSRPRRVGGAPVRERTVSPLPPSGEKRREFPSPAGPEKKTGGKKDPARQKAAGASGRRVSAGQGGGLERLLSRLDPGKLETEDLLVLAILWLLYRDSGDKELLIAMGLYLLV